MNVTIIDIGRSQYDKAWQLQKELFDLRNSGAIEDVLILTEHDHVYTIGKSGDQNHLLASEEELSLQGIGVFNIDRGGDITYHGPGQIVGYPILDLNSYGPDIHLYMRRLEEVMIRALKKFKIDGVREEGMTGVWVNGEKIGAIGVKVSRWITMHGFALNVNTDLSKFDRIVPCGIFHKGVTSMSRVLEKRIVIDGVKEIIVRSFEDVFGVTTTTRSLDDFLDEKNTVVISTRDK